MSKKHVFISYVRENEKHVKQLANILQQAGEMVWYDRELDPGDNWPKEIERALGESYAVIICFSKEFETRDASEVYAELRNAIKLFNRMPPNSIYLIPVRFSPCSIPDMEIDATTKFSDLHVVDLYPREKLNANLNKLLRGLRKSELRPKQMTQNRVVVTKTGSAKKAGSGVAADVDEFVGILKEVKAKYWVETFVICAIFVTLALLSLHAAGVINKEFRQYLDGTNLRVFVATLSVLGPLLYRLGRIDASSQNDVRSSGQMLRPQPPQAAKGEGRYRSIAIALDRKLRDTNQQLALSELQARRLLRSRGTLGTALFFALAYLAAAATQGLVQQSLGSDMTKLEDPLKFVALFMQSILVAIAAIFVGHWQIRWYRKRAGGQAASRRDCFRIVFVGIFLAGIIWILQISPEQLLEFGQISIPPIEEYFGTSYLVFLLVSKFLLFPTIGLIGGLLARGRQN